MNEPICWLSLIVIILLIRNYCHILDDFRAEKNPHNKYKIYHYQSKDKDFYYAKVVITDIFWCVPVYVKYKMAISSGFEDYRMELVEFDSEESAIKHLTEMYEIYRKKNNKAKIKRVK